MPYMTRIPSDLARFGLRVELVPGWESRGPASFAPACVVDHWTAGPRGTTGRPSLNVVINGRPGLSGPLANVYLARDGAAVVVAAGRANHAGAGGFRGLVGNSAAYGIEAEAAGDGDWTPAMLAAYPRVNAALLSGLGRDATWLTGHHLWAPTRKIDIRDIFPAVQHQTALTLTDPGGTEMTPEESIAVRNAAEHAGENRRMLGVLLGWNAPATGNERDALVKLYGEGNVPDVDEEAIVAGLASMLGARLDVLPDSDIRRIAEAVADEQSRRLTA